MNKSEIASVCLRVFRASRNFRNNRSTKTEEKNWNKNKFGTRTEQKLFQGPELHKNRTNQILDQSTTTRTEQMCLGVQAQQQEQNKSKNPELFPHWYEFIDDVHDYEQAWETFRNAVTDNLFEGLAVPLPYLHDALFYNLNAAVLERRTSILAAGNRTYRPAGPLRRLCSAITAKTYQQISTAGPTTLGPWFSNNYSTKLSAKHNGVLKEIQLSIENIYRSTNDDIPHGEYQVNTGTLAAFRDAEEAPAKSPTSPLEDGVFDVLRVEQQPRAAGIVETPVPGASWRHIRSPAVVIERAARGKWQQQQQQSIYAIHELIYAESVSISVRIGGRGATYRPTKFLRDKRAFPIGFTMTKYDIQRDGFIKKREVMRGSDLTGSEWDVVENVPWPPKPPEPRLLGGDLSSVQRASRSTVSTSTGLYSGVSPNGTSTPTTPGYSGSAAGNTSPPA